MSRVQGYIAWKRSLVVGVVVLALCIHAFPGTSQGAIDGVGKYRSFCKSRLAKHTAEMERIHARYPDSPGVKVLADRFARIEELAVTIANECSSQQSAAMDDMLNDVLLEDDFSVAKPAAPNSNTKRQRRARDIYDQFKSSMHAEIPALDANRADAIALQQYLQQTWAVACEYVQQDRSLINTLDAQSRRRVLELFLVAPLLQTRDLQWTVKQVESLPEWMRANTESAIFEEFTLTLGRPLTALRFHQYSQGKPGSVKEVCGYLAEQSVSLQGRQMYLPARDCLQAAMKIAAASKEVDQGFDLAISLARLYADIGHSPMAAGTLQSALDRYPKATSWGRGALLRLKYLYNADNNAALLADAPKYRDDPRCTAYLPQIMYVQWVTMRREGKTEAASSVKDEFLANYAESVLAADMHFASAMQTLAAGEYDKANRLLDIVRYRYPTSRVAEKARSIQDRIGRVLKEAD